MRFACGHTKLEDALEHAGTLSGSRSDRALRSKLYFQIAENNALSPERRLAWYVSVAEEAALAGGYKIAADSHSAILAVAAAPGARIDPPFASMMKAIEFAYRAGDMHDERNRARQQIDGIAKRYDIHHPLQRAVARARKLDCALDSEPADVVADILATPAPRIGMPRSASTNLSSSPLNASARPFLPQPSDDSADEEKSPEKSLLSEEQFEEYMYGSRAVPSSTVDVERRTIP